MSAIIELLYREYCRARLTEMRKQLLVPTKSDENPQAPTATCERCEPGDQGVASVLRTTLRPSGNRRLLAEFNDRRSAGHADDAKHPRVSPNHIR
jgi:hypothetical protein